MTAGRKQSIRDRLAAIKAKARGAGSDLINGAIEEAVALGAEAALSTGNTTIGEVVKGFDSDGDGVEDSKDKYPNDPTKS